MSINTSPVIICGSGNSIPFLNSRYNSNGFKRGIEPKLQWALNRNYSIGMNYFNKYGGQTTFMTSVDWQFYVENYEFLKNLNLIVCAKHGQLVKRPEVVYDNTIMLPFTGKYHGKDSWSKGFYSSHLVSLFTLTICIALGFKEIYLLGCDSCEINGKTHFYQDLVDLKKPSKASPKNLQFRGVGKQGGKYNSTPYNDVPKLNDYWYHPYLQEKDVKIYNVSPESSIDIFEKIDYQEFYKKVENNKIYQPDALKEIKSIINAHTNA